MREKSTRFDVLGFHKSVDGTRRALNLNWKQVAEQTGVGPSTLTRIARGKAPDAVTLAVLARWANVNPTNFLTDESGPASGTTLGAVLAQVRRDQALPPDVKGMLEAVITSAMERVRPAPQDQRTSEEPKPSSSLHPPGHAD